MNRKCTVMILSHFTSKYLTTVVYNIFRIKNNEYTMKVCLAAPVNLTGNLPLLLKLIRIFIVSSNKKKYSKKVRILSKAAWKS